MRYDPLSIDESYIPEHFTEAEEENSGIIDEPHPLLSDPSVRELVNHLGEFDQEVHHRRYPNGAMATDAYFVFEEGSILRREVVVKIILDYLRERPHLLTP